jgi:hypothetical protein
VSSQEFIGILKEVPKEEKPKWNYHPTDFLHQSEGQQQEIPHLVSNLQTKAIVLHMSTATTANRTTTRWMTATGWVNPNATSVAGSATLETTAVVKTNGRVMVEAEESLNGRNKRRSIKPPKMMMVEREGTVK